MNNPLTNSDPTGLFMLPSNPDNCVYYNFSSWLSWEGHAGFVQDDPSQSEQNQDEECAAAYDQFTSANVFPNLPEPPGKTQNNAPNNGTPASQVSAACKAQLLGMLNAEHGTNLADANVTGTYLNGTAGNLLISATALTAAQFNSFQPGRYTSYGGQFLLGFGWQATLQTSLE